MTQFFHLLKASEGGRSQRDVLASLKALGIPARRAHSPYIGHYGIEIAGDERTRAKVGRLLFRP